MKEQARNRSTDWNALLWLFGILFFVIGLMNAILVHIIPGIFYMLLSLVYLPKADAVLINKTGYTIPLTVKIILGILVLWGTFEFGELFEKLAS